jgi:hypothetical protein
MSIPNSPRKYQHIWDALKLTKGTRQISYVTLNLPAESHDTVLLALRKECIADRAFRALCIEEGISFEIGFNRIGDTLQLYLRWKPYVTNAFVITPDRIAKMKKWRGKKKW